jgi:hypothetical protein
MISCIGFRHGHVRGWLQVDHKQREAAESLVAAAHHDLYSGGWGFPSRPFNWPLYVFYGGDLREGFNCCPDERALDSKRMFCIVSLAM